MSKQYDMGTGEAAFHSTVKDLYRQGYLEVFDLAVATITSRLNQLGYKIYSNIEQLLVKACSDESYEENLSLILSIMEKISMHSNYNHN